MLTERRRESQVGGSSEEKLLRGKFAYNRDGIVGDKTSFVRILKLCSDVFYSLS